MASSKPSTAMRRPPSAKPKATEPSEISKPSSTSSPVTSWPIHPLEIATSPIFVAALIGVEKILRIDFDTSLPEETYVHQALEQIPEQTIAFGRPIGVTINYAPDRAVRYDLEGNPIETLSAIRCGRAFFTVPPREKDISVQIGKAVGLRSIS